MTGTDQIRVILVDDHTVVRSGLGAVLETCDTIEMVGEAANGEEAVGLCERVRPDVVLMDLLMPKMDGVTATGLIHERWPHVRVIALTSYKEKEYVEGVLKAGAIGYLLKNVTADELIAAIEHAMEGQPSLSPEATQVLIQKVNEPASPESDLTEREREILALMVDGKSNGDIADELVVSQSTVKFHVSNILTKLEVATRTEAVAYALKHRLVQ